MGWVFSGRVSEGFTDFKFFRGSPKANEKTRSFSYGLLRNRVGCFLPVLVDKSVIKMVALAFEHSSKPPEVFLQALHIICPLWAPPVPVILTANSIS